MTKIYGAEYMRNIAQETNDKSIVSNKEIVKIEKKILKYAKCGLHKILLDQKKVPSYIEDGLEKLGYTVSPCLERNRSGESLEASVKIEW